MDYNEILKNRKIPENGNILPLVLENDPRLNQISEEYIFEDQQKTNQLVLDLSASMIHYAGIGISAIQAGIAKRVFLMEIGDDLPLAIFNPTKVDEGPEIELEEGCLSFPKLVLKVKRPLFVRARFTNLNGEVITYKFEGLSARIFEHEYDHLDGITMRQKVSRMRYEMAVKKRSKR